MKELYEQLGISSQVYDFCHEIEESLKERFEQFDKTAEYNQMKVLLAMQKNRVSEECFGSSSGYGYNDYGRDTLEKVYADTFHTEACLVRPQIACGTHALAIALFGNLRPGDEMLAPAGKPYDTLEEVIGIRPSKGSLAEYGVTYRQVDLLEDGTFDYENIRKAINEKTKLVAVAQVSNVLGCVNPIEKIVARAHEVGAVVVMDGAQSVPHMPVDVQKLDVDFMAFSGHKLMGPMGIGVLYGKEELLEKIKTVISSEEFLYYIGNSRDNTMKVYGRFQLMEKLCKEISDD